MDRLEISTPGRICLFGEHQDYLNLPIIASAISKRIKIYGSKRRDLKLIVNMPDINSVDTINLEEDFTYKSNRDYLRSSINVLKRKGFSFKSGFDVTITGNIPINSGTSSSTALVISWINFLVNISNPNIKITSEEIANLGYESEVLEFSEPGGMMDHYSTALGNVIWLQSSPFINVRKINADLGSFILANSEEPKDTKEILSRVKRGVTNIVSQLKNKHSEFSLNTISIEEIDRYREELSEEQYELLAGTINNRDITFEAEKVLSAEVINHQRIGRLLNLHQNVLRDVLKISTPKINLMIETALKAGAFGAKINGSGGGGCMFAYTPQKAEEVLEALLKIAPQSWIISIDEGTKKEI